jgi:hypothetical protein
MAPSPPRSPVYGGMSSLIEAELAQFTNRTRALQSPLGPSPLCFEDRGFGRAKETEESESSLASELSPTGDGELSVEPGLRVEIRVSCRPWAKLDAIVACNDVGGCIFAAI